MNLEIVCEPKMTNKSVEGVFHIKTIVDPLNMTESNF